MDFAQRLKNLLNEKNISAYRLAKNTGVHQTTIANWIQGKTKPDADRLKEVAECLDVSVDYLLGNEEPTKVIDDDYIKFAMFGTTDVTDEEFEDVKRYAQFIKDRKKNESK